MKNIIVVYIMGKQCNVWGGYSIPNDWTKEDINKFVRELDKDVTNILRPMDWIEAPKEYKEVKMAVITYSVAI